MYLSSAILGPAIFGVLFVLIPILITAIILAYLSYLGALMSIIAITLFIIYFSSKKKIRKRFLITPSILLFIGIIFMIPFFILGGLSMKSSYEDQIRSIQNNGAIYYYAEEGNLRQVKKYVEAGEDINGSGDRTPLMAAVLNDHYKIAEYLIENGADINAVDNNGDTALHLTVIFSSEDEKGRYSIIEKLIEKGADVNAQNDDGATALISMFDRSVVYIDKYTYEIVKLLIDSGTDIEIRDESDHNVLDYIYSHKPDKELYNSDDNIFILYNKLIDLLE